MAGKVKAVPDGYHTVTPYLIVDGAAEAIEFCVRAFGAKELLRAPTPDGRVMHAEIQIGDSRIMLADAVPEKNAHSPRHYRGSPITLALYVEDADTFVRQAVAAGATEIRPVALEPYGDRSGSCVCPWGHTWHISTHVADVPPGEVNA